MSPAHVEAGINIKNAAGNNPSVHKPMFGRGSQIGNRSQLSVHSSQFFQ